MRCAQDLLSDDISRAAEDLGLSRQTFYDLLNKYGLGKS